MTSQVIPLAAVPSQAVTVLINNKACQIEVYQRAYGLFMDLTVDNVAIVRGVLCQNYNRIVRSLYLGFDGDFCFYDQQGSSDPDYTGLATRFALIYIPAAELPPLAN